MPVNRKAMWIMLAGWGGLCFTLGYWWLAILELIDAAFGTHLAC